VPYLTPPDVPEERDCRALLIPKSTDWLAIFGGALTELSKTWNWQQEGITIDEALEVVNEVIAGFYAGCTDSGCTLPDGDPIIHLNSDYEMEQLVDGEWVPPQGDYELPPTPPREESTPEDRICMAAANAVNCLRLLYEGLSDAYNEGLTETEAVGFIILIIIGIIGSVFGLALAALIKLLAIIFTEIYLTVEFITADLWTLDFTHKLVCMFIGCASESGDVVHFDIPCVVGKIAEATTPDWDLAELRLLLQLGAIFNMLGTEAIDAAGATTAVEEYDCTDCACTYELYDGCGYSTITNIGGRRWRVVCGDTGGGNVSACVNIVGGAGCFCYCNLVVTGTISYTDVTNCDSINRVGMPSPCGGGAHRTDIFSWFIQSNSGPLTLEFDVYCNSDDVGCTS